MSKNLIEEMKAKALALLKSEAKKILSLLVVALIAAAIVAYNL